MTGNIAFKTNTELQFIITSCIRIKFSFREMEMNE